MFRLLALATVRIIVLTIVGYVVLTVLGQPAGAVKLLEVLPSLLAFLVAVLAAYEASRRRRDA
jgi:hypothetical protein